MCFACSQNTSRRGAGGRRYRQEPRDPSKHHVVASIDPVPRAAGDGAAIQPFDCLPGRPDALSGRGVVHAQGLLRRTARNLRAGHREPGSLLSSRPKRNSRRKGVRMSGFDLQRRLAAEALGTGYPRRHRGRLGHHGRELDQDVALALLGNTLPTGAILVVLITILGPISGAHFNPAVTLVMAIRQTSSRRQALLYVLAQIVGGILGHVDSACHVRRCRSSMPHKIADWPWTMAGRRCGRVRTGCDHPRPASNSEHGRYPGSSGSTSPRPIGSPPPHRSPILPSRLRAPCPILFPASADRSAWLHRRRTLRRAARP